MDRLPKVVLLGAGNLATNLALAMQAGSLPILQIYSRTISSAQVLKEKVGRDIFITDNLNTIISDADIYICSLKDDALFDVLQQIPDFGHGLWVHTSGSLPMTIFEAFTDRYGVLYPLQTFTKERPVPFDEIPICIETSFAQDLPLLRQFAELLSHKVCDMNTAQRGVLHLAAVFANNFTNSLYATASELLAKENIPFGLLLPIIDETARKVHDLSPLDAQTGPAKRMDANIIDRHIRLLEEYGLADTAELYRQLTHAIHNRYDNQ